MSGYSLGRRHRLGAVLYLADFAATEALLIAPTVFGATRGLSDLPLPRLLLSAAAALTVGIFLMEHFKRCESPLRDLGSKWGARWRPWPSVDIARKTSIVVDAASAYQPPISSAGSTLRAARMGAGAELIADADGIVKYATDKTIEKFVAPRSSP